MAFWNDPVNELSNDLNRLMNERVNNFMVSAMTTSHPRIGFPPRELTWLCMMETADGAIRFEHVKKLEHRRVVAISRKLAVPSAKDPLAYKTNVIKREYELVDRTGPEGRILHYREVV